MKSLKKFFSFFKKQENVTKDWDEIQKEKDEIQKEKWEAQTALITLELQKAVNRLQFETVFRLLENGADPNAPIYTISCISGDNGLDYYEEKCIIHVLDHVDDKAMIRLLRSYGAKTSTDMEKEEREKKKKEREQAQLEHDIQAGALVDSLLHKQTQSVCFG